MTPTKRLVYVALLSLGIGWNLGYQVASGLWKPLVVQCVDVVHGLVGGLEPERETVPTGTIGMRG